MYHSFQKFVFQIVVCCINTALRDNYNQKLAQVSEAIVTSFDFGKKNLIRVLKKYFFPNSIWNKKRSLDFWNIILALWTFIKMTLWGSPFKGRLRWIILILACK